MIEIEITNLRTMFLINVYAPNKDDPTWFQNLFQNVQNLSNNNEIWVRDWNVS